MVTMSGSVFGWGSDQNGWVTIGEQTWIILRKCRSKHTTTVALTGTSAPGTAGIFQSFGDLFELENNGRVVFVAKLADGTGGVDPSNNTGVWIGTSDQDLRLLVRTGDVIDGKVVTELPFGGTSAGHPLDINENRVLWRGNLGPAKALVISRIGDDSGGGE